MKELKLKMKFKEASEVLNFQTRLQILIKQASEQDTAHILAAHTINSFLRKKNLFFSYPRPQASLTLDTAVNVAIFVLTANETDFYFQNIRNQTHQKLLA